MIFTKVEGGLGNQLFIYAASRALAIRTGLELKFDTLNGFEITRVGDVYLLDKFNVVGSVASREELAPYERDSRGFYWRKKLSRRLPFAFRSVIEERSLFDARLLTFRPRAAVYLMGYWQREQYFADHAATIRRELTPVGEPSSQSRAVADEMRRGPSVFLHLRRGKDFRYQLTEAYYTAALKLMLERVPHARVFVFGAGVRGDDQEWARRALSLPPGTRFVTHNSETSAIEDLWLMTQCRHAIAANSTFSWWGAWLNPEPDRVVVAPAEWGYRAVPAAGWLTVASGGFSEANFVAP